MNNNNREMDTRKRKINGQDPPIPKRNHPTDRFAFVEENNDATMLKLTLSTTTTTVYHHYHHPPPPPPLSLPTSLLPISTVAESPSPAVRLRRRKPSRSPSEGTISPPYTWSTNLRATVHSLDYLLSKQISFITGDVECKRCERRYKIEFDLHHKFIEIGSFIAAQKDSMHQRAPRVWLNPTLPRCSFCEQENSARPLISDKKRSINWLFLLLGQMLGCCTLEQLKYFCKHTKNHRTGAKDRVLYLTYLALCKQLDPTGPFDI